MPLLISKAVVYDHSDEKFLNNACSYLVRDLPFFMRRMPITCISSMTCSHRNSWDIATMARTEGPSAAARHMQARQ